MGDDECKDKECFDMITFFCLPLIRVLSSVLLITLLFIPVSCASADESCENDDFTGISSIPTMFYVLHYEPSCGEYFAIRGYYPLSPVPDRGLEIKAYYERAVYDVVWKLNDSSGEVPRRRTLTFPFSLDSGKHIVLLSSDDIRVLDTSTGTISTIFKSNDYWFAVHSACSDVHGTVVAAHVWIDHTQPAIIVIYMENGEVHYSFHHGKKVDEIAPGLDCLLVQSENCVEAIRAGGERTALLEGEERVFFEGEVVGIIGDHPVMLAKNGMRAAVGSRVFDFDGRRAIYCAVSGSDLFVFTLDKAVLRVHESGRVEVMGVFTDMIPVGYGTFVDGLWVAFSNGLFLVFSKNGIEFRDVFDVYEDLRVDVEARY